MLVAAGPLLLIADHRPAPSCLPVFAVHVAVAFGFSWALGAVVAQRRG